jgi:hypothetical protein
MDKKSKNVIIKTFSSEGSERAPLPRSGSGNFPRERLREL